MSIFCSHACIFETDDPPQNTFYRRQWPRCMSKSDLPDILFPANWEQQQEHAVESAKAWIRQEQGEGTGDAEDENKKEEDSQSTDEMHYCQFIASLKHCPALTTGFLADGNRNDRPVNTNICFCPCSAYMGEWQSQNRISVGGVNNSNMFDGLLKCSKQQYTPKDLLQHCEEVAGECGDSESRILHAIIHKYLECLFGEQEGLAHMFEATLVGDDDEEEKSKEDLEIMNEIRQDIQRLEEVGCAGLLYMQGVLCRRIVCYLGSRRTDRRLFCL